MYLHVCVFIVCIYNNSEFKYTFYIEFIIIEFIFAYCISYFQLEYNLQFY